MKHNTETTESLLETLDAVRLASPLNYRNEAAYAFIERKLAECLDKLDSEKTLQSLAA